MDVSDSDFSELSACECPVCFFLLEDDRVPMSLPCGHTLCRVCLSSILEKNAGHNFRCPLCRKDVQTSAVSTNITLKNLIGKLLLFFVKELKGCHTLES